MEQVKAYPTDSDGRFMDLRDYFAAKSIPTVFKMYKHELDIELPEGYSLGDDTDFEAIADRAYALADAMMEVRKP
jgi:hypothetical protein